MVTNSSSLTAFFLSAWLGVTSWGAFAQELPWYDGTFAHAKSDLKASDRAHFGTLPNGVRYVILKNQRPQGRASVWLNVQTGAYMETPDEAGIAHYLEHMAFNGTTNFPPGQLIPWFQKHGMSFGGDTNAHTASSETVYTLELSASDQTAIKDGLSILRDMADRMTLLPEEVDEERGIILAEKKARDSEAMTLGLAWSHFMWPDHKFAEPVIGYEKTIKAFTAEDLRRYYEKWYVPGRMVVIVTGDVNEKAVEGLITDAFSSIPAKPLPWVDSFGPDPKPGLQALVQKRDNPLYIFNYVQMFPRDWAPDNKANRRLELVDLIGRLAVSRRLARLTEMDPTLWRRAGFVNNWRHDPSPNTVMSFVTDKANFTRALQQSADLLKGLETQGISQEEMDTVVNTLRQHFVAAAQEEVGLTNREWAEAILQSVNSGSVLTTYAEDLSLFDEAIPTISLKDVNDALKASLTSTVERIRLIAPERMTSDAVIDAWTQARQNATAEGFTETKAAFPYLPKPVEVQAPPLKEGTFGTGKDTFTTYSMTLKNGLNVVMMPIHYEKNRITVTLGFGGGLQGLPDDAVTVPFVAERLMAEHGPGRLRHQDAMDIFSFKGVTIREVIGEQLNLIAGDAAPTEVDLLLEGVRTAFKDPTLFPEDRQRALLALTTEEKDKDRDIDHVTDYEAIPFFEGPRRRSQALTVADFNGVSDDAVKDYLKMTRQTGPRTLLVTGTFDAKAMAQKIATVFSDLAPTTATTQYQGRAAQFPEGETRVIEVPRDNLAKARVMVAWHFDTPVDASGDNDRFEAKLLAGVIREALRETVREGRQLAYSPGGGYRASLHDGGYGLFSISVDTDADKVEAVTAAIDEIVTQVQTQGVKPDVLSRLIKTQLTAWNASRQNPRLWTNFLLNQVVLGLDLEGAFAKKEARFKAATPEAVQAMAKRIFSQPRATMVIVSTGKNTP